MEFNEYMKMFEPVQFKEEDGGIIKVASNRGITEISLIALDESSAELYILTSSIPQLIEVLQKQLG